MPRFVYALASNRGQRPLDQQCPYSTSSEQGSACMQISNSRAVRGGTWFALLATLALGLMLSVGFTASAQDATATPAPTLGAADPVKRGLDTARAALEEKFN